MHPYASAAYAQALGHVGEALFVEPWDCHIIVRPINAARRDATGPYPIMKLPPHADITAGIEYLKQSGLVSLVMVLDTPNEILEKQADLYRPYKTHYLYRPALGTLSYREHHRRALAKAHERVEVRMQPLRDILPDWCGLYAGLIERLELLGVHAFPHRYHQALAEIDGFIAACGYVEGTMEACHLWVEHDGIAFSHLVANSARGQECRAGFAVNNTSLQHFHHCHTINFGGGAGLVEEENDGLARFKRGFSNDTQPSYLCGLILNPEAYHSLTQKQTDFFPAYRAP